MGFVTYASMLGAQRPRSAARAEGGRKMSQTSSRVGWNGGLGWWAVTQGRGSWASLFSPFYAGQNCLQPETMPEYPSSERKNRHED